MINLIPGKPDESLMNEPIHLKTEPKVQSLPVEGITSIIPTLEGSKSKDPIDFKKEKIKF